jgi:hypothetical protein
LGVLIAVSSLVLVSGRSPITDWRRRLGRQIDLDALVPLEVNVRHWPEYHDSRKVRAILENAHHHVSMLFTLLNPDSWFCPVLVWD